MIVSPLTGGTTTLIRTIAVPAIVDYYKDFDVTALFHELTEIELRECTDTGYRFYYPYHVTGDDAYYQHLAKEPLYYIPWKWEHEVADSYIKTGDIVLEQGCANGDFLVTERERKQIIPFGTELNTKAQVVAQGRGISFTATKSAQVVCSFQVLEHIADVKAFITEALTAADPGGYIIFGVPNNDALLKDDRYGFLNMPPHHMGLWSKAAFLKLPDYFAMDFVEAHFEPLQSYHYRYYYQVYFGDRLRPLGFIGKVINKLCYELVGKYVVALKAKHITGHTIVAVFKKR
jgi:SAM-dependent methyltransferase